MKVWQWFKDLFKKEDRKEKPKVKVTQIDYPIERIDTHNTFPIPFPNYYPEAIQTNGMKTQGPYPKGFPEGAVVHYHAGRFDDPYGLINYARKKNYCFIVIDRKGNVYQDFKLSEWGYHAGKSQWKNYKGTVHTHFVGIEVMAAGTLTKNKHGEFVTYWGQVIPENEVVEIKKQNNNQCPGLYHKFSDEQEVALTDVIIWFEKVGKPVFKYYNVVGHDEVCIPKGRKTDPGGALSVDMSMYRKLLYDFKPSHKKEKT